MSLLEKAKLTCRVTTYVYNDELTGLIEAAFADLGITDIKSDILTEADAPPLIERAVLTYCKMNFGFAALSEGEYERLKRSYDEQKKQLLMSSTYTDWGDSNA